jgi:hypothetical protein
MGPLRGVPLGFQQITSLSSAKSLTVPVGAKYCLLSVDSAPVRWRDDGTAPTATVGVEIINGQQPFEYWGTLSAIEFIAASGSPVLNVSFYSIAG